MNTARSGTTESPSISDTIKKLNEAGMTVDLDWLLARIRNPNNWTDDFFNELDRYYSEFFNRIRNTLAEVGKWEEFDIAYCEWKRPGQFQALSAAQEEKPADQQKKTACDRGKARTVKKADFHLDQAKLVEVKEPEWLIPGYIPKYGITTIAGEGGVKEMLVLSLPLLFCVLMVACWLVFGYAI